MTKLAQAFVKFLLTLPGPRSFDHLLTQPLGRVPRSVKDFQKTTQSQLVTSLAIGSKQLNTLKPTDHPREKVSKAKEPEAGVLLPPRAKLKAYCESLLLLSAQ